MGVTAGRVRRVATGLALGIVLAGVAQPPPAHLASGFAETRMLGGAEAQTYEVTLAEGGAIIGEADQQGIDVAVDIIGPDGRRLLTIDGPTGAQGPEPIDFTAPLAGLFRIVVRPSEAGAAAGHYRLTVAEVLEPDANAARLAAMRYPSPALFALWQRARTDSNAVERFLAERRGQGPLVEPVGGDDHARRVTYLFMGDAQTEAVRVSAGPHAATGGMLMTRFLATPLFYASEIVPADARFTYGFALIATRRHGAGGQVVISEDRFSGDPLNARSFGGRSLLELPDAAPQDETAERPLPARGRLAAAQVTSRALGEVRPISVYTPPGWPPGQRADLLIVLDGRLYASRPDEDGVPVPTILDNLQADGRIGPIVAIFVNNLPGRRDRDLAANPAFSDFLGGELIAWARSHYPIARGPRHVVVAGSSLGAVAAAHCALRHPESVGNVLSQSGAFWLTGRGAGWRSPYPNGGETGLLIEQYRSEQLRPVRFAMSVGRFEDSGPLFGANREFRDVLLARNYPVSYEEVDGGHEPISWRGTFGRGLVALIGRRGG